MMVEETTEGSIEGSFQPPVLKGQEFESYNLEKELSFSEKTSGDNVALIDINNSSVDSNLSTNIPTLNTNDDNNDSENEVLSTKQKKFKNNLSSEAKRNKNKNLAVSSDSEDEVISLKKPIINESKDSDFLKNEHVESVIFESDNSKNPTKKKFSFYDSSDEEISKKTKSKDYPKQKTNHENRKYSERSHIKKEKMNNLLTKIKKKKKNKPNTECEKTVTNYLEPENIMLANLDNKDLSSQYESFCKKESEENFVPSNNICDDFKEETKKSEEDEEYNIKESIDIPNKKKIKVKRVCKSEVQEVKSELQRMSREQTFKIPSHVPKVRPIQEFLKRVPKLKSTSKEDEKLKKDCEISPYQQIIGRKPKLNVSAGLIEFDFDEKSNKETNELDSFLQKLAKQANKHKTVDPSLVFSENKNNQFKVIETKSSQVPGENRLVLKKQLKEKIIHNRLQTSLERSKQMKMENDSEEEYLDEEVSSSESEENDNIINEASGDEEIENWNVEDERKQVEDIFEGLDEKQNKEQQLKSDNALSPSTEDLIRWEDSSSTMSSILPAGQGEPSDQRTSSLDGKITPSTKLLKSVMLDSASKTSCSSDTLRENEASLLNLPCEDTQDLYKTSEPIIMKRDSQMHPFSFSLDEDSHFDQILDSQGFLQSNKVAKTTTKKLFEDELSSDTTGMSMSQVLGLCSGKFFKNESIMQTIESSKSLFDVSSDTLKKSNETSTTVLCSAEFDVSCNNVNNDASSCSSFEVNKEANANSLLNFCSDSSQNMDDNKKSTLFDSSQQFQDTGLIGLCSGKFLSEQSEVDSSDNAVDFSVELSASQSQSKEEGVEENDSYSNEKYIIDEEYDIGEDDTNETDVDEESLEDTMVNEDFRIPDDSENEEITEWKESQAKGKKRLNKKAFYENEAELSGSDVGSEDEELGSEYDEYEEDSIDEDLPTEEKLKKQVHRIHQKKVLDQDKHELRLLQELYLEDGDLGGGAKRKRNFRWQNIDDTGFEDQSSHLNSDGEEELNMDADVEQKIVRLQKEKFLQELQSEGTNLDENSQSILNMIKDSSKFTPPALSQSRLLERVPSHSQSKSVSKRTSGSFLASSNEFPRLSNGVVGTKKKSTKSFVFLAEEFKDSSQDHIKKDNNLKAAPSAKRIKLDRCLDVKKNSKSIFSHF
ncbi:claspin isoform X3 [Hydra vulgaris]|uniref:Claspin isoform X3 n=1 Tax=Hydra vulgaris TaxID=6087 RepID=A0ABM4CJY3_HYDVU